MAKNDAVHAVAVMAWSGVQADYGGAAAAADGDDRRWTFDVLLYRYYCCCYLSFD